MKSLLCLITAACVASGCAPNARAEESGNGASPAGTNSTGNFAGRESGNGAASASDEVTATFASQTLPAIRVLHVHQYEDRLPGDATEARMITLVEFEVDSCKSLYDGDVKIRAQDVAGGTRLSVQVPTSDCASPKRQTLTGSTNQVHTGRKVGIENPVLIEMLAPSE